MDDNWSNCIGTIVSCTKLFLPLRWCVIAWCPNREASNLCRTSLLTGKPALNLSKLSNIIDFLLFHGPLNGSWYCKGSLLRIYYSWWARRYWNRSQQRNYSIQDVSIWRSSSVVQNIRSRDLYRATIGRKVGTGWHIKIKVSGEGGGVVMWGGGTRYCLKFRPQSRFVVFGVW